MPKDSFQHHFTSSAIHLVQAGGGEVSEQLFVEQPGVLLLTDIRGDIREEALALFRRLNLYTEQDPDRLLAEFAARITYLSFPVDPDEQGRDSERFHGLLKRLGHSSPYKLAEAKPNVLVAGLSVESMFELVANKYRAGRTSSSRTAVMDLVLDENPDVSSFQAKKSPLYRVNGNAAFRASLKDYLKASLKIYHIWRQRLDTVTAGFSKKGLPKKAGQELLNMAQPGNKAGYIVLGESPDFWHEKLRRRLSDLEGAELELRLVCVRIWQQLREVYPYLFTCRMPGSPDNLLGEMKYAHDAEENSIFSDTLSEVFEYARGLREAGARPDDVTAYEALSDAGHDPALVLFALLLLES